MSKRVDSTTIVIFPGYPIIISLSERPFTLTNVGAEDIKYKIGSAFDDPTEAGVLTLSDGATTAVQSEADFVVVYCAAHNSITITYQEGAYESPEQGQESLSDAAMGNLGVTPITGTDATTPDTGYVFTALQALADTVVAANTGNHDLTAYTVIPAGTIVYGLWTSITLTSGEVAVYNGKE
jgi:hypothetical protein